MKNTLSKTLILLLLIPTIFSCSKTNKCKNITESQGIISSTIDFKCLPKRSKKGMIIDNDSTLRTLVDTIRYNFCAIPNIDFTKNTVLGLYADGSGCDIRFIKVVTKNSDSKNYHYKVQVLECGTCDMLGFSGNWVVVPKLPKGWGVTFEITKR